MIFIPLPTFTAIIVTPLTLLLFLYPSHAAKGPGESLREHIKRYKASYSSQPFVLLQTDKASRILQTQMVYKFDFDVLWKRSLQSLPVGEISLLRHIFGNATIIFGLYGRGAASEYANNLIPGASVGVHGLVAATHTELVAMNCMIDVMNENEAICFVYQSTGKMQVLRQEKHGMTSLPENLLSCRKFAVMSLPRKVYPRLYAKRQVFNRLLLPCLSDPPNKWFETLQEFNAFTHKNIHLNPQAVLMIVNKYLQDGKDLEFLDHFFPAARPSLSTITWTWRR